MKKKKTRETPKRQRRRVDRREVIRTLTLGAGAAVLASTVLGGEDPDPEPDLNGQYYVHDDGYGYLIVGFTALDGWWVVEIDDDDQENGVEGGEWAINPAGHVFDSGFWWPMNEFAAEGVYFDGFDSYIYLHEPELEWIEDALIIDDSL